MKIAYLNLQAAAEGQASYAHVRGVACGLSSLGHQLRLFEPPPAAPRTFGHRLVAILATQIRLARSIGRFDVLYVRAHHLALPALLLSRLRDIPIVVEVNGFYEDCYAAWPATRPVRRVLDPIYRQVMRSADAIIAVTSTLASWASAESGGVPAYVVPNAAQVDLFRPNLPPHPAAPNRQYAVFFGALAPWQGLEVILEARRSTEWPKGMDLVIVGDGVLAGLVRETSNQDRGVRYLGRLPYREVPSVVANATCSLIPMAQSERSCSPVKLYESLACGVPVVVSDIEGLSNVIDGCECGEVVPAGDSVGLAQAVARILNSPDRAAEMGLAARALATTKHSWAARALDTESVIREVWRNAPRR